MATKKFWGLNDSLWGGETFTSTQSKSKLKVVKGDQFRVEMGANGVLTMIPNPDNDGTWNESHSATNPITLTPIDPKRNKRAFSMMVKISKKSALQQLFFVERNNLTVAIKKKVGGGGTDDGTASVEA